MSNEDKQKQEEMREWYDSGDYFDTKIDVFADMESPFQKYRLSKVLQIYHPSKEERVLDLGCGWGTFTFALAPICKEVVGLDYSAKSVEICRKLAKKHNLDNIEFVRADASETEQEDNSFDVVIAADLFEHLYPDISIKTVNEAFRVLKPGGKFVIWTPHRGHFLEILKNHDIIIKHDPAHVDYKSMKWLIDNLKETGFDIEKQYYAESHLPVLRTLEKAFIPILPWARRRIAILSRKPK